MRVALKARENGGLNAVDDPASKSDRRRLGAKKKAQSISNPISAAPSALVALFYKYLGLEDSA